jgi:hypothetical protein
MGSRTRLVAIAVLLAATAAACANGDASRNQARDAMLDAGLDDDQANCVGNALAPDGETGLTQDELNELSKADDISELSGIALERSDLDMAEFARTALEGCVEDPAGESAPETEPDAAESDNTGTGSATTDPDS